jgi:hypothetical protein
VLRRGSESRLIAGIAGSKTAEGMDVSSLASVVCCVRSGLSLVPRCSPGSVSV